MGQTHLITGIALVCGAAVAQTLQPAHVVHVAVDGNDRAAGTAEDPLATLGAARDAVRALKTRGLDGPVEVVVHEGTYFLREPLVLGPEDSGTAECPIRYRAAQGERVVLSGGVPISGWRRGEGERWVAPVPAGMSFRLLRVGDRWATRARHPNADPQNPYTGGWAFATWGGEPWERGQWGVGVANVHNVNDRLTWNIRVPADGTYQVWLRYGHAMKQFGVEDMGGRSVLSVDGGEEVPLMDLPDTGSWSISRWTRCAELDLAAGEHVLQWRNVVGGGINMDAFILCDDPDWDATTAVSPPTWWGAVDIKPPAEGKHLLVVQVEACDTHEGPEIQVPGVTPPGTTHQMRCAPGALPIIADPSGAEVHIFIAWGWVNAIVPVARIEADGCTIVFAEPGAAQDVRVGNRFFLENVPEALDAPGEWYLDDATDLVTYIPDNPGFPEQPTVACMLDRLIVLEGDPAGDSFVEHITIEGFHFTDTTHSITRDYYTPQDAAVWLSGARECVVRECEFAWCGGYAVRLMNRSEQCRVIRNSIHHMGQGGVILVGGTKEQAHHCSVLGNDIQHIGLIYKHVAGVYGVHTSDTRIAHNRIWYTPRYAISCKSQGEERLSHRNVIEFNDMRQVNLETNDTGAVETLGYEHRDSGNIIRHNLILDSVGMGTDAEGRILSPHFTWGVYLDDYSSGTLVYGNIIARTVNGAGCIHGGQNNVFQNNIMVEGRDHQFRCQPRDDFMQGNRFVNNIVVYSRPEAQVIYSWRDKRDMFAECNRNLYWLTGQDLRNLSTAIFPAGNWAQWQEAGFDRDSMVADPLFVDPEHDDYRLQPDSPALALGFQPIPVERIGPDGLTEE